MPFEVSGMEAVIAAFKQREAGTEEAVKLAVKAGGKFLAEKLKAEAPVGETSALHDSIKPGPVTYSATDGFTCEVKPVGNHPKTGEPLAKIGNVLEYGRSYGEKEKAGLAWFHPTVKAAEAETVAVMQAEFEKQKGG